MSYFRHFVKGSKKFKNMSSGAGAAPKKDGSETLSAGSPCPWVRGTGWWRPPPAGSHCPPSSGTSLQPTPSSWPPYILLIIITLSIGMYGTGHPSG